MASVESEVVVVSDGVAVVSTGTVGVDPDEEPTATDSDDDDGEMVDSVLLSYGSMPQLASIS